MLNLSDYHTGSRDPSDTQTNGFFHRLSRDEDTGAIMLWLWDSNNRKSKSNHLTCISMVEGTLEMPTKFCLEECFWRRKGTAVRAPPPPPRAGARGLGALAV